MGALGPTKVSYKAERLGDGTFGIRIREGSFFTTFLTVGQVPAECHRLLLKNTFTVLTAEFRSRKDARTVISRLGARKMEGTDGND